MSEADGDRETGREFDRDEIESLLGQIELAEASPLLDARMERFFQPKWRRMVGPMIGFAAGVAVTISVVRMIPGATPPLPVQQTVPIKLLTSPATSAPAKPEAVVETVYAQTRKVVDSVDGEIDGVPVRVQTSRELIEFKSPTGEAIRWQGQVVLPSEVTVEAIQNF